MSTIITEKKKTSFLRDVQEELKKVTWTSKGELIFSTKVVVISTFAFGLAIYAVDLGIHSLLNLAGTMFRMIFG
jgi:preprotein translocase subunit SecE